MGFVSDESSVGNFALSAPPFQPPPNLLFHLFFFEEQLAPHTMSLRKIPENEPVTGSEAGNDDDVLAPIRLAAQRSFDRRRREAAAANSANAGHGHGHLPASPGAESLAAPRLRRTISMPVSGAYSQALKTAKSIMAQLRIPQGAHPPPQIAGSNPSAPSGSQAPLRPAALTASSSDIAAPVFQRTMSSPIRGRSASRHTNVRSFSDASGETQKCVLYN